MSGNHLYVYGVVEAEDLELDVEGVEGASPVRTVDHRTLSAVVTDIDDMEPERTDENAQAHDRVLRAVLDHEGGRTVVPMQFGMTFKGARELKNVLRSGRRAFTKALRDVDGGVERGVKLVADEGVDLDPERVEAEVAEWLDGLAVESVANDRYSDRLVLNRSYLVLREETEAFETAVDDLEDVYDGVTVKQSGPFAPYSFVDIRIGAQ
ncbi:GvpL/GvpF family gas vesicle protein [Halobium salinum]|uniref:GvpL/GvpF family gas vesicle protein n=1 Tax=Halobium salinum TaxID=1364940 RepID=A0ABD5PHM7_9EURY|nr:GvpL/GvpF family gas vesicle protein [Halobium salinum]